MTGRNQSQTPILAAGLMVLAGASFAAVNVAIQTATMKFGMPSASAVFWQYAAAFACALPWLFRRGIGSMATAHPGLHALRIVFAVGGVQLWGAGLAAVPIWQAIALVMTSPFFVIIGAWLLLGERVGLARWGATIGGFGGAMLILEPWSDSFQFTALLPLGAACLWAGASLLTKRLTAFEPADTVTIYLLLLLTPVNLGLAVFDGFAFPEGNGIWVIAAAGVFTVAANYCLTLAYSRADAAYVQPFDHLKLPLNVLFGWLAFQYAPNDLFWLGALMIVSASFYIMRDERNRLRRADAGDPAPAARSRL